MPEKFNLKNNSNITPNLILKNNKQSSDNAKNGYGELSLQRSILISLYSHLGIILGLFLFTFILHIIGIDLSMFKMPRMKAQDTVFIFTDQKQATPINKNTKIRSDRNSRAGGKHDKTKPVIAPKKTSIPAKAQKSSPKASPKKAVPPTPKIAKAPPKKTPRPAPRAKAPVPTKKIATIPPALPEAFKIPVPSAVVSSEPMPSSVSGESLDAIDFSEVEPSDISVPTPMMASSGNSAPSRRSSSYSQGYAGNPSAGGDPRGSFGIDALKDTDFGPYMRDLEVRLKRIWNPPSKKDGRVATVSFRVAKDGRLLSVKLEKTSGFINFDNSAIAAVKMAAPFRPFPPECKDDSRNIEFKFNYNVGF